METRSKPSMLCEFQKIISVITTNHRTVQNWKTSQMSIILIYTKRSRTDKKKGDFVRPSENPSSATRTDVRSPFEKIMKNIAGFIFLSFLREYKIYFHFYQMLWNGKIRDSAIFTLYLMSKNIWKIVLEICNFFFEDVNMSEKLTRFTPNMLNTLNIPGRFQIFYLIQF